MIMNTSRKNRNFNSLAPRRYPDSILTDDRGMVRLSDLAADEVIYLRSAGNVIRRIKAGDIPLTAYTLECGHRGRGIALSVGNVLFCDSCMEDKAVTSAHS